MRGFVTVIVLRLCLSLLFFDILYKWLRENELLKPELLEM